MTSSTVLAHRERDQSILDQLPQVRLLARRLHRRCPSSVLLEDLVSAGVTGLIQAADRYDRHRNIKFKTLAEHRIRGAMLDYLRTLDPLSRSVRRFVPINALTVTDSPMVGADCQSASFPLVLHSDSGPAGYRRMFRRAMPR